MASEKLMNAEMTARCAEILKAMGHPVRLKIIELLCAGDNCVSELEAKLGVKQAIVSQQIKILRLSGLVRPERRDGRSFYCLAMPYLVGLMACLRQCGCRE